MLANGIKLGYKATPESSSFTNLPSLKEVPDMGMEPELVENTCLDDTAMKYEMGIGDYGDMEFTFKYENKTGSSYRLLKAIPKGQVTPFQVTFPDSTTFEFSAYANVKVSGGGVNDPIDFVLSLALQSDVTVVDPA